MANIFDKWDKEINTEALTKDVQEAAKNSGGDYEEVPHGEYDVAVEKMELKASKNGNPMVSIWFKILDGDFKNQIIFYNQPITKGFQIHLVNTLLEKMGSDYEIKFESYAQYSNLIMDIFEEVADNFEYALSYKAGKNGFSNYAIKEVYDV